MTSMKYRLLIPGRIGGREENRKEKTQKNLDEARIMPQCDTFKHHHFVLFFQSWFDLRF